MDGWMDGKRQYGWGGGLQCSVFAKVSEELLAPETENIVVPTKEFGQERGFIPTSDVTPSPHPPSTLESIVCLLYTPGELVAGAVRVSNKYPID